MLAGHNMSGSVALLLSPYLSNNFRVSNVWLLCLCHLCFFSHILHLTENRVCLHYKDQPITLMYVGLFVKSHFYLILNKLEFAWQNLVKVSNIKFYEYSPIGRRLVLCAQTEGDSDNRKLIVSFCSSSNMSTNIIASSFP